VPDNWSPEEVAATVASYCAMLELELRDQSFNKAQFNRVLRHLLNNRSEGAVEFKHANVSAVMIELGFPYIDGYKPRGNYQASLRAEITEQWDARPILATLALQAVAALAPDRQDTLVTADIFVAAPKRTQERSALYERPSTPFTPRIGVNYLENEARNASLGLAGEEFVLRLEHQRLWEAGERRLADRIEHVAKTQGDGLGYDIVSYENDGRERLIEVKTTSFGSMTPFYASRREVAVSAERAEQYALYRLYKFRSSPKVFLLQGALEQNCILDPVQYSVRIA